MPSITPGGPAASTDTARQPAARPALRIPRLRWSIGVLINYFDRINLSVAAPQLKHQFGLTDAELGWLFSGFFWSYALMQVPTGLILDRFGVTRVNRISTFAWSLMCAVTAPANGFGSIFGARILLGVVEAPGFPASSKATGYWFLRRERALATSIFDAAAKFSNVIGVPLVALASSRRSPTRASERADGGEAPSGSAIRRLPGRRRAGHAIRSNIHLFRQCTA